MLEQMTDLKFHSAIARIKSLLNLVRMLIGDSILAQSNQSTMSIGLIDRPGTDEKGNPKLTYGDHFFGCV